MKYLRNARVHAGNIVAGGRSFASKAGVAIGSVLASGAALATTTVGQTAATEISGAESQVELVQTAMLGVLILLVVFGLIRKSFGK